MKTPQEKAKELVDKMYFSRRYKDGEDYIPQQQWNHAKQCVLIAVDEIIRLHKGKFMCEREEQNEEYWQQVKKEIQLL